MQKDLMQKYEQLDLEKLKDKIKDKEETLELVDRTKSKCLYKRIYEGNVINFEVFKTKIVQYRDKMRRLYAIKDQTFKEDKYKEWREVLPSDEEFGVRAWSYRHYEDALTKFNEL